MSLIEKLSPILDELRGCYDVHELDDGYEYGQGFNRALVEVLEMTQEREDQGDLWFVDGHEIDMEGMSQGYCYSHQSFACFELLDAVSCGVTPEEIKATHDTAGGRSHPLNCLCDICWPTVAAPHSSHPDDHGGSDWENDTCL